MLKVLETAECAYCLSKPTRITQCLWCSSKDYYCTDSCREQDKWFHECVNNDA